MVLISRRDAIRTSGLIALAPVLVRREAAAQSGNSTKPLPFSGQYSPDLIAYANEAHFDLIVKCKRGLATESDILRSAGVNRLVAGHLDGLNVNPIAAYYASKIDSTETDFRHRPQVDTLYNVLRSRESSFTREEVDHHFQVTSSAMEAGKQSIMKNGLTYQLHCAADIMYKVAHAMGETSPSASLGTMSGGRTMSNAVFEVDKFDHPGRAKRPHLVYVQNSGPTSCQVKPRRTICELLGDSTNQAAAASLIALGMANYGKIGANVFCASDAIGSLAADIASMGWGATATTVEAGLCGGAQAYATFSATRGGIILNVLAAKHTLSAVSNWFGCS